MAKTVEDNRTVSELRQRARELEIPRAWDLRKEELRRAVDKAESRGRSAGSGRAAGTAKKAAARPASRAAGSTTKKGATKSPPAKKGSGAKGAGRASSSRSRASGGGRSVTPTRGTAYAQEIGGADEHEERTGRSLVTTDHDVIRRWAEARGAMPATITGTEHGDRLGVLRFDFGGDSGSDRLRHVSWEEWFATFDDRNLNFIYQEHRTDGSDSTFFRLDNPDREDA